VNALFLTIILVFASVAPSEPGIPDETMPDNPTINTIVELLAANQPEAERERYVSAVLDGLGNREIDRITQQALIKHYTPVGIDALSEFFGSPVGKSILHKFPAYTAEITPAISAEVDRARLTAREKMATLHWEEHKKELVLEPGKDALEVQFPFRNASEGEVEIVSVTPSSACLQVDLKKTKYQPGETGVISALFIKGDRQGVQRNGIIVDTTGKKPLTYILELTVQIPQPLTPSVRFVYWPQGGDPETKELELTWDSKKPIEITGVAFSSDLFTTELWPGDPDLKEEGKTEGTTTQAVIRITPASTGRATPPEKMLIEGIDSDGERFREHIYVRVVPTIYTAGGEQIPPSWSGKVIWVDSGFSGEYNETHIPGAVNLNEDAWESQIRTLLEQWTPDSLVVVYGCISGCRGGREAGRVARRLHKEYGLPDVQYTSLAR